MMRKRFSKFLPYFPIFLILVLASFLRLYRISDYMTFLGDEGRDALVWLRMVREGKFTLIGPTTSIGNMYLGPLYYYLMLPFFILFRLSPVGPSIGVAFFGVVTTFLIWRVAKVWFDEKAGLMASLFYAISPVVVTYSRSSWNPNVMPFFSLLTIGGIWEFWQKKNFFWFPIIGVTLSFALQSHYLGILLLPVLGIFWLATIGTQREVKTRKNFLLFSVLGCLLFIVLTFLPLVWFDLRHDFLNYHAFYKFFSDRQTTVNFKIYKAIPNIWPLWEMMITRLLVAKEIVWGKIVALGLILGTAFCLWRSDPLRGRTSLEGKALILILVWLGVGLGGMGLYKQHIYDHYFGFMFPAVFLLAGFFLSKTYSWGSKGKIASFLCFLAIFAFNLREFSLKYPPNSQMARVQEVDKKIIAEADEKPFNLGLIAKQNYDAGYSFFLEYWGKKPVAIDPQRFQETVTDQLFVVCEDNPCEPVGNSKAEIANFGWVKIEREWEFPWGVGLFKLVHNPEGKQQ